MQWTNNSKENPGYSVHSCKVGNILYVIRKKRPDGPWRVFYSLNQAPLKTMYVAQSLKEARAFVKEVEESRAV